MTTLKQAREALADTIRQSDPHGLSVYHVQVAVPQIPCAMIDLDDGPVYSTMGQHMVEAEMRLWLLESLSSDWTDGQNRLDARVDLVGARSIPRALLSPEAAWRGILSDVQFFGYARIPAVDTPGPVFIDWNQSAYWGCALKILVRYGIA